MSGTAGTGIIKLHKKGDIEPVYGLTSEWFNSTAEELEALHRQEQAAQRQAQEEMAAAQKFQKIIWSCAGPKWTSRDLKDNTTVFLGNSIRAVVSISGPGGFSIRLR